MQGWTSIDDFLRQRGIRFGAPTFGQTLAPRGYTSLHPLGRARDYGNANSDVAAIASALTPLAQGPNAPIIELFWSPGNVFFDDGRAFSPSAGLRAGHQDHVHVGLRSGVDLTTAAPPATPGAQSSDNSSILDLLGALTSGETAMQAVKLTAGMGLAVAGVALVVGQ